MPRSAWPRLAHAAPGPPAAEIREQHRRFAAEVAGWLAHPDDRAVRDSVDRLAVQDRRVLGALAHRWRPALWRRNRVLFAPLVVRGVLDRFELGL